MAGACVGHRRPSGRAGSPAGGHAWDAWPSGLSWDRSAACPLVGQPRSARGRAGGATKRAGRARRSRERAAARGKRSAQALAPELTGDRARRGKARALRATTAKRGPRANPLPPAIISAWGRPGARRGKGGSAVSARRGEGGEPPRPRSASAGGPADQTPRAPQQSGAGAQRAPRTRAR